MSKSSAFLLLFVLLVAVQLFTASASNHTTTTTTKEIPFPQSVVNYLGTRTMRYHHFVWHNLRNLWNKLNSTTQEKIRKLGWAPPRPALRYDSEGYSYAIEDNNSGEDFLYKHRVMIAEANAIIAKNNDPYGKLKGWTTIPAPNDTTYPVPANYTIPNNSVLTSQLKIWKADYIYNKMKAVEKNMTDPVQLRNMTLGQLGARIEFTVHNYAHMRFSDISKYGYRPGTSNPVPTVDTHWDNLTYNWLGDNYGSALHPLFWKIHCWVDDRIEDWRKANNIETIQWKGTWTGGNWSNLNNLVAANAPRILNQDSTDVAGSGDADMDTMSNMDNMNIDVLEQVAKILTECGEESHFYDPIVSSHTPRDDELIVHLRVESKKTVSVKTSFRTPTKGT